MQDAEIAERPDTANTAGVPRSAESPPARKPAAGPKLAESIYAEGNRLLRADEQSMAIAKFLDAADLRHAMGAFKAALMYFIGAGITRNTGEATRLARLCLELDPPAHVADACREIASESLGTHNAVGFLREDDADMALAVETRQKRKKLLIAGSGVLAVLAVAAVVAGIFWNQKRSELDVPPAAGTVALITQAEAEEARKEGLALIAGLKAAASTAQQAASEGGQVRKNDF
jgi:TPR repeat protein